MSSLASLHLQSNTKIKINFNGSNLSSDAGLLLLSLLSLVLKLVWTKPRWASSVKSHVFYANKFIQFFIHQEFFWIWTQRFFQPTESSKGKLSTTIIRHMVITHWFVMTDLPDIC